MDREETQYARAMAVANEACILACRSLTQDFMDTHEIFLDPDVDPRGFRCVIIFSAEDSLPAVRKQFDIARLQVKGPTGLPTIVRLDFMPVINCDNLPPLNR